MTKTHFARNAFSLYMLILGLFIVNNVSAQNIPGSLDSDFNGGYTQTSFTGGTSRSNAVLVRKGGKVLVAGNAQSNIMSTNPDVRYTCFAVAQYNADGTPDMTFNGKGYVRTIINGNEVANAIALGSDGSIYATGYTYIRNDPVYGSIYNFAIVKYTPTGQLDTSFSDDGIQTISFGSSLSSTATAIKVLSDGSIIVAGELTQPHINETGTDIDFALVKLLPTGLRDLTFDGDGRKTTSLGTGFNSVDQLTSMVINSPDRFLTKQS